MGGGAIYGKGTMRGVAKVYAERVRREPMGGAFPHEPGGGVPAQASFKPRGGVRPGPTHSGSQVPPWKGGPGDLEIGVELGF